MTTIDFNLSQNIQQHSDAKGIKLIQVQNVYHKLAFTFVLGKILARDQKSIQ